jgi:hypothetical protein
VPRRFILRCIEKHTFLDAEEIQKLCTKREQIERAQDQLAHVISVVEKCLLKGGAEVERDLTR